MSTRTLGALVALLVCVAHPASGQEGCPFGAAARGHLGITIGCDCTVSADPTARPWRFRSPIRVAAVEPGGPAADRLRVGDLIVGIDGVPVTTAEGARQLSTLRPGATARLEIVRNGVTRSVYLAVGFICPHDPRAIGSYAPSSAAAPAAPAAPAEREPASAGPVPLLPDLLPAGRLGFALACAGCGWERAEGQTHPRWHSEAPPVVYAVEPDGPAADAGLRAGDVLVRVAGLPITEAGGAALGAARPGEPLRLEILRDRRTHQLTVTPAARHDTGALQSRYSGSFGGVEVDVRSAAAATVTVSGAGDELTIVVNGAVVRLRVPGGR